MAEQNAKEATFSIDVLTSGQTVSLGALESESINTAELETSELETAELKTAEVGSTEAETSAPLFISSISSAPVSTLPVSSFRLGALAETDAGLSTTIPFPVVSHPFTRPVYLSQIPSDKPVPTNQFWTNFYLQDGKFPVYAAPYTYKWVINQLIISHPTKSATANFVLTVPHNDIVFTWLGTNLLSPIPVPLPITLPPSIIPLADRKID